MFETAVEVLIALTEAAIIFCGAWVFTKFVIKLFKE